MRHALYLAAALVLAGGPAGAGDDLVNVMRDACAAGRNVLEVMATHRTPTSPTFAELAKLRADWNRNCAPWIIPAGQPPATRLSEKQAHRERVTAMEELRKNLTLPPQRKADPEIFDRLMKNLTVE